MIEDYQDDYYSTTKQKTKESNKEGMVLFVFVIWVIFATILIVISFPQITTTLRNIQRNNSEETKNNTVENDNYSNVTLYFVKMQDYSKYSLLGFKTNVKKTGESLIHDAIEGLLKGATDNALKYGAISTIPASTKLIGATVSSNVAFIDLSYNFLPKGITHSSTDYVDKAKWQFLKTLQDIDPSIKNVVILVEGKQI